MLSLNLRRRRNRRLSALRKRSLRRQYTNRDDGHGKTKYTNDVDVRPYQSRDDQSLIDVPCGKLDSVFMHLGAQCP